MLAAVLGAVTVGTVPAVAPMGTGPPGATDPTSSASATGATADLMSTAASAIASTAAGTPGGMSGAELRPAAFTTDAPDGRAHVAIAAAMAQIGLPYVWGGDGPTNGDAGFDCSGLTKFSYGAAGVPLPRTAHTQYYTGPHVPNGAPLQPGDLVFYGTPANVHHVGMYIGAGRMVNAPTFGEPVQVAFYRYRGDDYLGATRPAANPGSLIPGVLPYLPPAPAVPSAPPEDRVFRAPVAPLPPVLPQPGDRQPSEAESAAAAIAEGDKVQAAQQGASVGPQLPGTQAPGGTGLTTPPTTSPATETTSPATTPGTTSPETTTPTTTVPPTTTPKPIVPAPTTPPAGTARPESSPPATPAAAAVHPTSVELPAGSVPVTSTGRSGRIVVRLGSAALLAGAAAGSPVVVTYSDGATKTSTATAVREVTAAELAAALTSGKVVVVAPAPGGGFTVLTAS